MARDSQRHDHSKGERHPRVSPLKVLADPLWEQQKGEGQQAYYHFRAYRDLPRRSLTRVATMFEVTRAQIAQEAAAKRWEERAAAYDAWLDTRSLAVTESSVRNEAAKTQKRIRDLVEEEWELGKQARDKIKELLAVEPDPKTALRDAAGLIRESTRMARLGLGLPTEGGRARGEDDKIRGSDIDAFLEGLEGAEQPPAEVNSGSTTEQTGG